MIIYGRIVFLGVDNSSTSDVSFTQLKFSFLVPVQRQGTLDVHFLTLGVSGQATFYFRNSEVFTKTKKK